MDLILKNLDKQTETFICYIAEKSGATVIKEKKSKALKENADETDQLENEILTIINKRLKGEKVKV